MGVCHLMFSVFPTSHWSGRSALAIPLAPGPRKFDQLTDSSAAPSVDVETLISNTPTRTTAIRFTEVSFEPLAHREEMSTPIGSGRTILPPRPAIATSSFLQGKLFVS